MGVIGLLRWQQFNSQPYKNKTPLLEGLYKNKTPLLEGLKGSHKKTGNLRSCGPKGGGGVNPFGQPDRRSHAFFMTSLIPVPVFWSTVTRTNSQHAHWDSKVLHYREERKKLTLKSTILSKTSASDGKLQKTCLSQNTLKFASY